MKSILLTMFLMFSANAFADVTNGSYECTFERQADQDPSEALYSFVFDLTDEYIVIYEDDSKAIASILLIKDDETVWTTDSEGDKYKVERTQFVLKTTYSTESKDDITGEVAYRGLSTTEMRETKDGKYLFKVHEIELDVVNGAVTDTWDSVAICNKK